MTSKIGEGLRGFAKTSQDGARESINYYTKSGKDERRLIKASFFMGVTGAVLWYILSLYWLALGFTSVEIGIMGGIGSAVSVVTLFFSGFLADKFGRKWLFLLGLAGDALGIILFLSEKNLVVFTIAYSVVNLSGSLVQPSLIALLATKAKPGRLKFLFGLQSFSNQIGLTLTTLTGIYAPGFLFDVYGTDLARGYWYVFLVAAACAFVPIMIVLTVTEPPKMKQRLLLSFDKRIKKILFVYSLQSALIGFGAAMAIPWIPMVFESGMNASTTQVSLMLTLSNVAIAIGWFVIPKFSEAMGAVALVTICQIASVAFLVLIPFSPYLVVAAVLYMFRSLLMLVPTPILNAYVMNIVSEEIRASFIAISQLAWTVAFSAAYALSGYIWANDYSSVTPFFICGVFYTLASLVFFFHFRNIKETKGKKSVRTLKTWD